MSLFLILLVVDALIRIVSRGLEGKIVEGFEVVGHDRVLYLIFQFADDTIFFRSSKEEPFLVLNHSLAFFEVMLGLKINREKCQNLGLNYDEKVR